MIHTNHAPRPIHHHLDEATLLAYSAGMIVDISVTRPQGAVIVMLFLVMLLITGSLCRGRLAIKMDMADYVTGSLCRGSLCPMVDTMGWYLRLQASATPTIQMRSMPPLAVFATHSS